MPRTDARSGRAVIVSGILHGLIVAIVLWQAAGVVIEANTSGERGPAGGGGGGGGRRFTLVAMAPLQSSRPVPAVSQPVPVPVQVPTVVREIREITPIVTPVSIRTIQRPLPLARVAGDQPGIMGGPGAGTGSGGGVGSGRGTGDGNGVGPGSGGEGGGVVPPSFRRTELPPEPRPAGLHGRRFELTFFVNEDGRVTDVEISPEIPHAGYRKRWMDALKRYRFRPAVRADGTRVPGKAVQVVTL